MLKSNGLKFVFFGFRKTPYPPLGIGYLISNLRKHGFNFEFQYQEALENIDDDCQAICKLNPDIVGLSATSADFVKAQYLAKQLKKNTQALILLGGAHLTSAPQTMPKDIDVGFLGESEETIIDVFNAGSDYSIDLNNLKNIPGIAYHDETGALQINKRRAFPAKLDNFDRPARDIFSPNYWETGVTSLMTSRGCPYKCSFCQVSAEWRVCRYHSAEYVVNEIKDLYENYKIHTFGIIDDLFAVNKKRIIEITQGLEHAGLLGKVRFAVNGRANLITDELVELLIKMGTCEIALGLESMSPKILPLLKDKVTVEDNVRAVDTIYRHGLKTGGLYIIGTPTETIEDMAMTYDYVKENRHKFGGMQICITTPLPNTALWDLCAKQGLVNPNLDEFDWNKCNIAAEDINTNTYVGQVEPHIFRKALFAFRELFHSNPIEAAKNPFSFAELVSDKLDIKNNFILPGTNDRVQVRLGSHEVESWAEGKVFWTEQKFEGYLKPVGNETQLKLEFYSGVKATESELYRVNVTLINESTKSVIATYGFDCPQQQWLCGAVELPSKLQAEPLKILIESDTFVPKELKTSTDHRTLGIAVKGIYLQ